MVEWLEKRWAGFYVVVNVPRKLRKAIGKKALVRSLKTRDPALALVRGMRVRADFEAQIEQVRRRADAGALLDEATGLADELSTAPITLDRAMAEAHRWRKGAADDWPGMVDRQRPDADTPRGRRAFAMSVIEETADEVANIHGQAVADDFVAIATGHATPLLSDLDAYLAMGGRKGQLAPRTATQQRQAVLAMADWMQAHGIATVEKVTPRVVGRYVSEVFVDQGVKWSTANYKIAACSAYWQWMVKRRGVESNPWRGQLLARDSARFGTDRDKRAFTTPEVVALLAGNPGPELGDAMLIGALSGLRLEEIFQLTVADCADGIFDIRKAKSPAGVRKVPIHSGLVDLVAKRCADKQSTDYVMHEATRGEDRRGGTVGARFTRYRRTCGVEEQNGRQSKVDFHSWRRWFTTVCRNAGNDTHTVDVLTGHRPSGITDSVYNAGPTTEMLRAAVESVKLPDAKRTT